jgi:hypothetical protein
MLGEQQPEPEAEHIAEPPAEPAHDPMQEDADTLDALDAFSALAGEGLLPHIAPTAQQHCACYIGKERFILPPLTKLQPIIHASTYTGKRLA